MSVNDHRLILASASPRRRQILAVLGIPYEAIEVDVDETPHLGEAPETLARRLAVAKADAGAARHPDSLVLGADTVVELDGGSLGKPSDAAEAVEMLQRLRGRRHQVITGVALTSSERAPRSRLATTEVWMASYTAEQIARTYELADLHRVNLLGAVTWAFEFEGQPYFAGFRDLATNGIDKPVLNVFRMFAKMSGRRIAVESDAAVPLETILRTGVRAKPDPEALEVTCPGCADKSWLLTP